MRKLILIVHASIDGFVADKSGTFDNFNQSPENLDFVNSLTNEADTALAGRVSYQMLESAWPSVKDKPGATESEINYSNWYNRARKIVLSTTLSGVTQENMIIISEHIPDEIQKLKGQGNSNILMFGSPTAFQTLFRYNLIDEYYIILYPVVFGRGIPLFSGNEVLKHLKLTGTKQLSKGEIVLNYQKQPDN
ncbi:MAG TPA: dihydrofolate reductase family protein [Niabella sp.]|nr:dihydrofolate reductase family protein [Niabella sp.]